MKVTSICRRSNTERRNHGNRNTYPLKDRAGRTIPCNRSYLADRRHNNICVQMVSSEEFLAALRNLGSDPWGNNK